MAGITVIYGYHLTSQPKSRHIPNITSISAGSIWPPASVARCTCVIHLFIHLHRSLPPPCTLTNVVVLFIASAVLLYDPVSLPSVWFIVHFGLGFLFFVVTVVTFISLSLLGTVFCILWVCILYMLLSQAVAVHFFVEQKSMNAIRMLNSWQLLSLPCYSKSLILVAKWVHFNMSIILFTK